jgi:hypothetical protein
MQVEHRFVLVLGCRKMGRANRAELHPGPGRSIPAHGNDVIATREPKRRGRGEGRGRRDRRMPAAAAACYKSVSVDWPGNKVARLHSDQSPGAGLFGSRSCRQQMVSALGAMTLWVWPLPISKCWVST